jgi:trimethylamine--corrinoid protein Co-methyltransferase
MDMMTGESLYSGVSKALAAAAANELAAWQGLSIATGNYTTLCSNFGVQNGMEHAFGVLSTFFAPGHCWHGMGSVANACGMSPVQIVIDHDLTEVALRLQRGIDITDETLALESIVSVGPRGNFLADPLTLKYLRSDEHFFPSSYERCAGGQDVKTMAQRAHERAEDLIANHKPAVPQDRLQEVRRYVERELSRAKSGAKEED